MKLPIAALYCVISISIFLFKLHGILFIKIQFLRGTRGREDFLAGLMGLDFFESVGSIGLKLANDAALFGVMFGVSVASTFLAKFNLNGFGVIISFTSSTESSKVSSLESSLNSNCSLRLSVMLVELSRASFSSFFCFLSSYFLAFY